MKTIIAGGRDYRLTAEDSAFLDLMLRDLPITEVLTGHAKGADQDGEEWAKSRSIPVQSFPADWARYGRGAGHVRNGLMAEQAECLIVFPGGRGTLDMVGKAKKRGLRIIESPSRIAASVR